MLKQFDFQATVKLSACLIVCFCYILAPHQSHDRKLLVVVRLKQDDCSAKLKGS